jgi:hypothetical protein
MGAQLQAVTDKIMVIGNTALHGIDLIGEALARAIALAISIADVDMPTVRLCENEPKTTDGKDVFARLFVDTNTIMVNLGYHIDDAAEQVIEDGECNFSVRALAFFSLLITIFHEAKHVSQLNEWLEKGGLIGDFAWTEEHEKEAKAWANTMIDKLAMTYPAEVDAVWNEEDPFFDSRVNEVKEAFKDVKDDDVMAKFQLDLLNEGIVASNRNEDKEEPLNVTSFVEWLRLNSENPEDPAWKQSVIEPEVIETPEATPQPAPTIVDAPPMPEESYYDMGPDEYSYGVESAYNEYIPETPQQPVQPVQPTQPATGFTQPVNNQPFVNPVMVATGAAEAPVTTTSAPAPPQQNAKTCAPPTIQIEECMEIVKKVTLRLYTHIFTKCGFDPQAPSSFTNAGAVFDPVSIVDIPNVDQVFKEMDVTNEQGQYQRGVPIQGQIRGVVFNKSGLPGYWLYVNAGGKLMKRTLVPQNPNKMKNGGITTMARRVREGHCVAWFIADEGPADERMKAKISVAPGGSIEFIFNPFNK